MRRKSPAFVPVLTEEQEKLKAKLLANFEHYFKFCWDLIEPNELKFAKYQKLLCKEFNKLKPGQKITISLGPGTGKSLMFAIWRSWQLTKNPKLRILTFSQTLALAERDNMRVRDILQSEQHVEIFGELVIQDKNNRREKFLTHGGGSSQAMSILAKKTGFRADNICYDDIFDAEAITDPVYRQKVLGKAEYIWTRINDLRKVMFVNIAQALHPTEDARCWCIKHGFREINIPFLDANNKPLHDRLGNIQTFIEQIGTSRWLAEYQGEPQQAFQIVKPEWIKPYSQPVSGYSFGGVDVSITVKNYSDESSIIAAIYANGNVYIREIINEKINPSNIKQQILNFYRKHNMSRISIEESANSTILIAELKQQINVKAVRATADKLSRGIPLLQRLENGTIFFHSSIPPIYTQEITRFGLTSKSPNIFDALAYICMDTDFASEVRVSRSMVNHFDTGRVFGFQRETIKW